MMKVNSNWRCLGGAMTIGLLFGSSIVDDCDFELEQ